MMISKLRKSIRDESGQGMTEYIIIVALIAIAAIGVVSVFGDNIRTLFGASADALGGNENRTVNTNTNGQALEGHKNLKSFSENNDSTT